MTPGKREITLAVRLRSFAFGEPESDAENDDDLVDENGNEISYQNIGDAPTVVNKPDGR